MSNISALLREAANEVANEEKEQAKENLQAAASQVNRDVVSGAISPRTSSMPSSKGAEDHELDVKEDVNALLEQMSLKPKYSGNTLDDVDALLNIQKKAHKSSSAASMRSMDQYRKRKSARDSQLLSTKSVASSRGLDGQTWNSTELSRVSVLLTDAEEKSWGRDIRRAFTDPHKELLFRSMKVVRPASSGGGEVIKNATAGGRLQRYTTCDLKLHALGKAAQEAARRSSLVENMRASAERLCTTASSKAPSQRELRADPTLRFATYEDAKECTFQPRIAGKERKAKKAADDEDEDRRGEEDKFAFINRQEAEERNRRDELEFEMGKAKYDARVDKKTCPRCGAKQSYDEFKEKRKNCVHCNVEYCAKVSWGKVGRRFFQSNLEFSQRVAEKKQRLRKEAEDEFKCVQRTEVDPRTGKTVTYLAERKQVLTPEEELEFFDRIEDMLRRREQNVKALEEKIYREKFPFKPAISSKARLGSKHADSEDDEASDGDGDGTNNPVRAFLKRYTEDLDQRRDKYPMKYVRSKSRPADDDLEPFVMSKSIDRGKELYL